MKKFIYSAALALSMLLSGCDLVSNLFSSNDRADLQDAINRLGSESGNWQQVLSDLQNNVSRTLQSDVQNLTDRAVASVGEHANCLADIRIEQIKRELRNMLARLNGQPLEPIVPIICKVSPNKVRMVFMSDPNYERVIELSGYDMDKGPITAVLKRDNGGAVQLGALQVQTHYHATYNFATAPLDIHSTEIAFLHNGAQLSAVPVEQKPCAERIVNTSPSNVSLSDWTADGGDKDFGFENAEFDVEIDLNIDGQNVEARVRAVVEETGGDHTKARKTQTFTLYTNPDPNFAIDAITSSDEFRESSFINNEEADETETYSSGGVVNRITYRGRRFGFDDRDHVKLVVVFNQLSVRLKERGDCLP